MRVVWGGTEVCVCGQTEKNENVNSVIFICILATCSSTLQLELAVTDRYAESLLQTVIVFKLSDCLNVQGEYVFWETYLLFTYLHIYYLVLVSTKEDVLTRCASSSNSVSFETTVLIIVLRCAGHHNKIHLQIHVDHIFWR